MCQCMDGWQRVRLLSTYSLHHAHTALQCSVGGVDPIKAMQRKPVHYVNPRMSSTFTNTMFSLWYLLEW